MFSPEVILHFGDTLLAGNIILQLSNLAHQAWHSQARAHDLAPYDQLKLVVADSKRNGGKLKSPPYSYSFPKCYL